MILLLLAIAWLGLGLWLWIDGPATMPFVGIIVAWGWLLVGEKAA